MPAIVWPSSKVKDATAKDPSLQAKIGPFLNKLAGDATSAGLHVEPIRNARDRRVRTARVTDFYRAVLFELNADAEPVYVFHGIWPHDDAIKIAESVTVRINPANGITEVTRIQDAIAQGADAVEQARREAQAKLDAAQREAAEIAREAARLQAANAQARQDAASAAASGSPAHPTSGAVQDGQATGAGAAAGTGAAAASAPDAAATVLEDAVVVASRDAAPTWPQGLSIEVLRDELGIDVTLAAAALAATRESQLLDLATTAEVPWQGEALLALATGSTIDDVRDDFQLRRPEQVAADSSDSELIEGLRTRAARSSFTWIENDEDLRRAIDGLTFAQWQVFLHPQQRALVESRPNGPMRISGGAGTGKTVVAVHRTVELARRDAAAGQEPHILLTTYTRNLADDLRRQVAELEPSLNFTEQVGQPGLMVSGLDKVARAIFQRAGDAIADTASQVLGRRRTNVLAVTRKNLWDDALTLTGDDLPENLRSKDFLESEYELVVLPQRVTTLQQYLRIRRPGRGVALDRHKRAAVWNVIEKYRDRSAELGVASFAELLALAAAWLDAQAERGVPRPYRHVLVDEAQDLTPAHLQLLRALVEPGPDDLFLAEDSHQRIYGKKITLSHYGIQVRGRSRRLTRNYRTTRQNLDLAFEILERGTFEDLEGQAEQHHYVSPRSGPDPLLLHAKDHAAELDDAAALLNLWLEEDRDSGAGAPESIAILVRDRYQRDNVVTGLAHRGVEVRPVDREAVGRGRPVVMTMHRAKGLEFRKVLLFDVSVEAIPRSLREQEYSEADHDDALLRECSLLYVAATRARDQLAISWSGQASPLLEGVRGAE
ncbi:UvrD-helicase domain-containing protein [Actinomyces sp. 594]|uniref:UvrD-helicase domain-containing protein n=1 Tax=Actinomyces sp. 594 TaxID=2057793 RepID=UPI001C573A40|nr:UvrD-helicase domain-containing protein [Actinomyces sp. 594]MBW3068068.1 UvrD-helicase domain-containing protein [Actinomyces sp. 594]